MLLKIINFILVVVAASMPLFANAQEVIREIVFPVDGPHTFTDTWGEARSGGRTHIGTDIITDKHTPLVSAVDGYVRYLTTAEPDWGYALYINDDEGYSYRYLHINNDIPGTDDGNGGLEYAFASGLRRGDKVTAGQVVAYAGDSGNAENVTSHLHFEIWTPQREPINSYPSLIAAKAGNIPKSTHFFSRDLELGDRGQDVLELQKYLNRIGYTLATVGAGSPGNETDYFGTLTKNALIKFQQDKNIEPAAGYFGSITRTLINSGNTSKLIVSPLQPGWLVKNEKFVEVFFVDEDYTLRWIVNEAAAEKHFGPSWNQDIRVYEDLNVFALRFGDNLE